MSQDDLDEQSPVEVSAEEDAADLAEVAADEAVQSRRLDADEDPIALYAESGNPFYRLLEDGFSRLRELRDQRQQSNGGETGPWLSINRSASSGDEDDEDEQVDHDETTPFSTGRSLASVNFIDPTSNQPASAASPGNILSQASPEAQNKSKKIANVFDKINTIFKRDYGSSLRQVPYRSLRGGGKETIPTLPVKLELTRTRATNARGGNASVAWGGIAGRAAAAAGEPSEWHTMPFCHTYVAAIEGMDHYKAKVKPSLHAFVSQIESSAAASLSQEAMMNGTANSAHYLIIYVPCGDVKEIDSEIGSAPNSANSNRPVRTALANRLQKARQRFRDATKADDDRSTGSLRSNDSNDEEEPNSTHGEKEVERPSLGLLSKTQRQVFQSIQSDFPYGKVCVLSESSLDTEFRSEADHGCVQEWNFLLRMMGSVIVNGFRDRCRRYTDELRRLDAQRANQKSMVEFNVCYFFLVKESLAFTFEQMQLHAEALLQYDEFKIYLPDEHIIPPRKSKRKSKIDKEEASLLQLVDEGDYTSFRRRVRSERDLVAIGDVMRRYLFVREVDLLFAMDEPATLLERCRDFLKSMHLTLMRGIDAFSDEEQRTRKVKAAQWVVGFVWDMKRSTDSFFTAFKESKTISSSDTLSVDTPVSSILGKESSQSEQNVALLLAELLEVSRMYLLEIGDQKIPGGHPFHGFTSGLPRDLSDAWSEWKPTDKATQECRSRPGLFSSKSFYKKTAVAIDDDTFNSAEEFESRYVDVALAIVTLNKYADRKRVAARLQSQMAEYYIAKGDLHHAASILKAIAKQYRLDQWDRVHFWILFRLAYCQRTTAPAHEYLKTLVTCFSPRTALIAPRKALLALQSDLEKVIAEPIVGEARYGRLAFLDIAVSHTESAVATHVEIASDRKQLMKRSLPVGSPTAFRVKIASSLPEPIEIDSLRLFLISFSDFVSIVENRDSVEEEDAARVLTSSGDMKLCPGSNIFDFSWRPMSAGQYVVSTVEVKWKQGYFYYDTIEMTQALLGVDAEAGEATHFISIEPEFLVPDHDQKVKVTFSAGSDTVTSVKLQLVPPPGYNLHRDENPGELDEKHELVLEPCRAGEDAEILTNLKWSKDGVGPARSRSETETSEMSSNAVEGLKVRAIVEYFHEDFDYTADANCHCMKSVIEKVAPLLENSAFTVESVDAVWFPPGHKALVACTLLSNTPKPYQIEDWTLSLSPPLVVSENGDRNGDLTRCSLQSGEMVSFAFECIADPSLEIPTSMTESILHVTLRDDLGKTFPFEIPLDLDDFYEGLRLSGIPTESKMVSAALALSSDQGRVGEAVHMTFTVDMGDCIGQKSPVKLTYDVKSDSASWIVAGQVGGTLLVDDQNAWKCDVVCIPIVAGRIDEFPILDIYQEDADGNANRLLVPTAQPKPFVAIGSSSQTGFAWHDEE